MATLDTLQTDSDIFPPRTSLAAGLLATLNGSEYAVSHADIALLLRALPEQGRGVTLSILLIDRLLRELDQRLSAQMDAFLHAPAFQRLESTWRGLALLVDNIPFHENIQLTLLHATQEELLADFEFSPDITSSGYYQHVYSAGYGQFGGVPVAAVIGCYDFTPGAVDIKLLHYLSVVSAMAHAPFLSAANATFFGVDSLADLPSILDLDAVMAAPTHIRWQALRATPDARYLGLTVCRFLQREPYTPASQQVRQFVYQEQIATHQHLLWATAPFYWRSAWRAALPVIAGARTLSGRRAAERSVTYPRATLRRWGVGKKRSQPRRCCRTSGSTACRWPGLFRLGCASKGRTWCFIRPTQSSRRNIPTSRLRG